MKGIPRVYTAKPRTGRGEGRAKHINTKRQDPKYELIAHPPSLLGRFLFEKIDQELEGDIVSHERVREILPRMKKTVEMLRDSEAPRAFLQGLSSHMEGFALKGRRTREAI